VNHRLLAVLIGAVGLLIVSGPLFAHHGSAAYDNTKLVTLTGTITDFEFIQPHPIISLDATDDHGNIVKWSIEMTSPNHLVRYGWNSKKLKPGDEITVSGNAAKNGLKVLNLRKISWTNGQEIPLGPPPEPGNNSY
jgi:Family of unknown function (DUF6152)